MNVYDPLCHTVTAEIAVPAESAFRYLADPVKLGLWALGCFDTHSTGTNGLYKGTSLFDGSEAWFRIETDPKRFLIDYHVGDSKQQLPRISTRIVPGPNYGRDTEHCMASMMAWRTSDMSNHRWQRLCATHDAEILMIQAQLESQSPSD
jgi:hypothetical protein